MLYPETEIYTAVVVKPWLSAHRVTDSGIPRVTGGDHMDEWFSDGRTTWRAVGPHTDRMKPVRELPHDATRHAL